MSTDTSAADRRVAAYARPEGKEPSLLREVAWLLRALLVGLLILGMGFVMLTLFCAAVYYTAVGVLDVFGVGPGIH